MTVQEKGKKKHRTQMQSIKEKIKQVKVFSFKQTSRGSRSTMCLKNERKWISAVIRIAKLGPASVPIAGSGPYSLPPLPLQSLQTALQTINITAAPQYTCLQRQKSNILLVTYSTLIDPEFITKHVRSRDYFGQSKRQGERLVLNVRNISCREVE